MKYSRKLRDHHAAQLASAIAWAVAQDIPLEEAFRSLLPSRSRSWFTRVFAVPFVGGILSFAFMTRGRYYAALHRAIALTRSGLSLADVAEKSFKKVLPPGFVIGLRLACDAGKEKELIPVLAKTVEVTGVLSRSTFIRWLYTIAGLTIFFLVSLLGYYIAPKFEKMMLEFAHREQVTVKLLSVFGKIAIKFEIMVILLLMLMLPVVGFIFLLRWRTRRNSTSISSWRSLLSHLPFFGKLFILEDEIRAAQVMYAYLLVGTALHQASDWTWRCLRTRRCARRWREFTELQKQGISPVDAIRQSGIAGRRSEWMLVLSLVREQPAEGFLLQLKLLEHEHQAQAQRLNYCFAAGAVFSLSAVVVFVCFGLFVPIITLIERLAELPV